MRTISLTGLALTCALTIPVGAGSLVFKGPAHAGVELGAGAVGYQGYAPTLDIANVGSAASLSAGGLTWQGLTPTVRVGDLTVELPAGQLNYKGPARPEVIPQIPAGSLAFQGRAFNVAVDAPGSAISIAAGGLAYTGQAPERIAGFALAVPVGSLNYSGQYLSVVFSPLGCGALGWHGLAPTPAISIAVLPIPAGGLVISSITLANHLGIGYGIPAGSLAFTAPAMAITSTGNIEIPCGSLVWQGQVTGLPVIFTVPVGSLGYSSVALIIPQAPELGVGALAYTGYQVTPNVVGIAITNPDVLRARVSIVREVSSVVRIVRTISSEVER